MTLYYFISLSHAHTHQVNTGDSRFQHPFYLLHNCCIECGTQNILVYCKEQELFYLLVLCYVKYHVIKKNGTVDSKRALGMWLINAALQ